MRNTEDVVWKFRSGEKTFGDRRLDDGKTTKENARISKGFGLFTVAQILARTLQLEYSFYHTKF